MRRSAGKGNQKKAAIGGTANYFWQLYTKLPFGDFLPCGLHPEAPPEGGVWGGVRFEYAAARREITTGRRETRTRKTDKGKVI